ncbi:MAG: hypothetical protein SF172_11795 [Burkholderiales bacterium]|nr:hypothetical protein [Burkholderiales bacterium]
MKQLLNGNAEGLPNPLGIEQEREALMVLLHAVVSGNQPFTRQFVPPLVAMYVEEHDRRESSGDRAWGDRGCSIEVLRSCSESVKIALLAHVWRLARLDRLEALYGALYLPEAARLLGAGDALIQEAKRRASKANLDPR